jgi:hypothetical protein
MHTTARRNPYLTLAWTYMDCVLRDARLEGVQLCCQPLADLSTYEPGPMAQHYHCHACYLSQGCITLQYEVDAQHHCQTHSQI